MIHQYDNEPNVEDINDVNDLYDSINNILKIYITDYSEKILNINFLIWYTVAIISIIMSIFIDSNEKCKTNITSFLIFSVFIRIFFFDRIRIFNPFVIISIYLKLLLSSILIMWGCYEFGFNSCNIKYLIYWVSLIYFILYIIETFHLILGICFYCCKNKEPQGGFRYLSLSENDQLNSITTISGKCNFDSSDPFKNSNNKINSVLI